MYSKNESTNEHEGNNDISLKNILKSLIEDSTSHGIPRLIKSRTILMKLIWLICLCISFGYGMYVIVGSFIDYFNYDTTTVVDTVVEAPSLFPAITLCNLNPVQTDYALIELNKFMTQLIAGNNLTTEFKFDDIEARLIFLNYLSSKNDTYKKMLAFSYNQTFLKCRFNTLLCKPDLEWYFDPFYGNCFRFNTGMDYLGNTINIQKITQAGDAFGLRLELFAGDPNKIPGIFINNGFRVMVNNQSNSLSLNEGVSVSSGIETSIRVNRLFTYQLGSPYNDCLETTNLDDFDSYLYKQIIKSNKTYTQKACFYLCAQQQVIEKCKCYFNLLDKLNGTKMCLNINEFACAFNYVREFFNNIPDSCPKMCPLECNSITYSLSVSTCQFPTKQYAAKLASMPQVSTLLANNTNYNDIQNSVLSLNIYYDELNYMAITGQAKYQLNDLISNMGGILGLFIGISFLSFVEIIEIIIEILFWCFRAKQTRLIHQMN